MKCNLRIMHNNIVRGAQILLALGLGLLLLGQSAQATDRIWLGGTSDWGTSPCLTSLDVSPYGVRAEFLVGHYIVVSSPFGGVGGRMSESLSVLRT